MRGASLSRQTINVVLSSASEFRIVIDGYDSGLLLQAWQKATEETIGLLSLLLARMAPGDADDHLGCDAKRITPIRGGERFAEVPS
jgi:hypothetical protein